MRFGNDTVGLLVAVLALLIGALSSGVFGDATEAPEPRASVRRPAPVDARNGSLPPPSNRDPELRVELGPRTNGAGTAFPVAAGVWMTARHVADSCDTIGIESSPRKLTRGGPIMVHENADLALFRVPLTAAPVAPEDDDLRIGQAGYHFGFPKGEYAALRSQLLGRAVMRASGRYSTREPIVAWAQVERIPPRESQLSGMSGGPVFDEAGRLIGVSVAEAPRRGRVYTAAPVSIRDLWARAGVTPAAASPVPPLRPTTFGAVSERLRKDRIVARVICLVR